MTGADLSGMSPADRYVWMALMAIDLAHAAGGLKDAEDLRAWWRSQDRQRSEADLSPEQEEQLIEACKSKIELIGDVPRVREPASQVKRPGRKRRAAI